MQNWNVEGAGEKGHSICVLIYELIGREHQKHFKET